MDVDDIAEKIEDNEVEPYWNVNADGDVSIGTFTGKWSRTILECK